jgi:hypothetical protein
MEANANLNKRREEEMKTFYLKALVLAVWMLLPMSAWAAEDLTDLLIQKGTITKEEADSLKKSGVSSLVDQITFFGDFRLREETEWYNGGGNANNSKNVNRQRYRLRIGSDITEGPIILHIRLASGTGQQVSTNQTMQALSSEKGIYIDRAYVEYIQVPNLNLMGGRMANPFTVSLTGELVFDDDYNPEGFAEKYSLKLGDTGKAYATLGQVVLDNNNPGATAQWLLGEQVGAEMKMDQVGINLAVLYYSLANGEKGNFGQAPGGSVVQDGNTRKTTATCPTTPTATNCTLANPFSVIDATASVTVKATLPVTVSGDYVKNLQSTVQNATTKNQDTGYAVGFKVGSASAANTYEFGYMYRVVQTDATLADIADSDWGPNGGTNRKGHIVWTAYNLTKAAQLKLKYFSTQKEKASLPPTVYTGAAANANPSFGRVQLDFSVKF